MCRQAYPAARAYHPLPPCLPPLPFALITKHSYHWTVARATYTAAMRRATTSSWCTPATSSRSTRANCPSPSTNPSVAVHSTTTASAWQKHMQSRSRALGLSRLFSLFPEVTTFFSLHHLFSPPSLQLKAPVLSFLFLLCAASKHPCPPC